MREETRLQLQRCGHERFDDHALSRMHTGQQTTLTEAWIPPSSLDDSDDDLFLHCGEDYREPLNSGCS